MSSPAWCTTQGASLARSCLCLPGQMGWDPKAARPEMVCTCLFLVLGSQKGTECFKFKTNKQKPKRKNIPKKFIQFTFA